MTGDSGGATLSTPSATPTLILLSTSKVLSQYLYIWVVFYMGCSHIKTFKCIVRKYILDICRYSFEILSTLITSGVACLILRYAYIYLNFKATLFARLMMPRFFDAHEAVSARYRLLSVYYLFNYHYRGHGHPWRICSHFPGQAVHHPQRNRHHDHHEGLLK